MTREKWEFPPPSPCSAILRRHIRMIRKKKGKNTHQDAKTRLGQSRRRGVPSDFLVLIRVRYIDSVSPSPVGAIVKLLYFIICAYFAVNLCVLSALSLAPLVTILIRIRVESHGEVGVTDCGGDTDIRPGQLLSFITLSLALTAFSVVARSRSVTLSPAYPACAPRLARSSSFHVR